MTLYSWSANVSTYVPVDAGGCGQTHSRPVENGVPQHPWGLTCPPCEDFLRVRMPDQWSATTTEIPETYDETKKREQSEKSGKLDRENQLAAAIIELGKLGALPEALGQVLAPMFGGAPAALIGKMVCPNGHDNAAGAKFCNECAAPMSAPVTKGALESAQRPAEPPSAAPTAQPGPVPQRIRDANQETLRALCRRHGVDDSGKRPDLIIRLSEAGVTNADLRRFLEPVAA